MLFAICYLDSLEGFNIVEVLCFYLGKSKHVLP